MVASGGATADIESPIKTNVPAGSTGEFSGKSKLNCSVDASTSFAFELSIVH